MLYPDTGRRSLVQYLSGSTGEPDGRTENRGMFMDTIGEAVLRSCQPYVRTVFNSVVVLNIMRTTHIVSMDVAHLANISASGQMFNYSLSFLGMKHVILMLWRCW